MRAFVLVSATVVALTLHGLFAAEEPPAVYELHEWGVFPVARNEVWAMSDLRAEWATFPDFFFRDWPKEKEKLPYLGPVLKPVVFFHTETPGRVQLEIRFADGRPLVWWPGTSSPASGIGEYQTDRLAFDVNLNDIKGGVFNHFNPIHTVDANHWVQTLRDVKASTVTLCSGWSNNGSSYDRENFIYYDGIMKAPATPKVTLENNQLVLETNDDFPLLDVLAVNCAPDRSVVVSAWTDKIEAGKQTTRIAMLPAAGGREQEQARDDARKELNKRLIAAGLNADEAQSLVKVWDDGMFKHDGLSVFYRVPQETYDKWLPLKATPAPKKSVRVGIVLHTHLEATLDARVEKLIAKLKADEFEQRQAARDELLKIGGAAFPVLEKHFGDADAETARSCREIVAALSVLPALKKSKADEKE